MNLASRWRDAVSHVQKLKKELLVQQRKSAEALALQKAKAQQQMATTTTLGQNQSSPLHPQLSGSSSSSQLSQPSQFLETPPMTPSAASYVEHSPAGSNNREGASLNDVAVEMNRMDRILAAHQSQSTPPKMDANHGAPRVSTSPTIVTTPSNTSIKSSGSFPDNTDDDDGDDDREEKKTQSMDQPVTPSPEKLDDDDRFGSKETAEGEDFFAMFQGSDTRVDLDDSILDVDDPPLEPPPTVTPSESPPPTPPLAESPPPPTTTDFETIHGPFLQGSRTESASPLFPVTASPKLMASSKVYNDGFPGDITSGVTRYPRSAERRTAADVIDEEESSAPLSTKSLPTTRPPPPPPLVSGFDAFEASFDTKFPESFSPSEDERPSDDRLEPTIDEYNPFFPSPTKKGAGASSRGRSSPPPSTAAMESPVTNSSSRYTHIRRGLADDSPPSTEGRRPSYGDGSYGSFSTDSEKHDVSVASNNSNAGTNNSTRSNWRTSVSSVVNDSPTITQTPPPSKHSPTNQTDCNSSSPPENAIRKGSNGVRYATPPNGYRSPEQLSGSEGPKRPEKSGALAARARYEKALQPRFQANTRRFPRKAGQQESESGTNSVGSPSNGSTGSNGLVPGKTEPNSTQERRTSELARAQARLKVRTSGFSGRTTLSALESKTYSSMRDNQPWARPSPTDSVGSKPWDEIGDIPMESSPATKNASAAGNGGSVGPNPTQSGASYSNRSPSNSNSSPATSRSSYTRQALARNRPWDTNNTATSSSQPAPIAMAVDTANHPVPVQLKGSFDDESPPSRFVAAGKTRRSVKQPVSYAEPSLSAKLRRGDVFFAKQDGKNSDENRTYPSTAVHL